MSQLNVTSLKHESASGDNITLSSNGNVGIGTSLPNTLLEVKHSASSDAIKISGNADSVSPYLSFENQEGGTAYVRGRIRGASNGVDGGLIFQTGSSGSMTERLRIDSAGRVTMPYQPAWFVRWGSRTVNSGSVYVYGAPSEVFHNNGSYLNTSTGVFTAPVSGMYWVQITITQSSGSANAGSMYIQKNGSDYIQVLSYGTAYNGNSSGVAILCSAGDQLRCTSFGNNGTTWNVYNAAFSGFLIG
jgi:hypothetical protein